MTPDEKGATPRRSVIRPPRSADRDPLLDTLRAADLLPDGGIDEVAADLDRFLGGSAGGGRWLVDADRQEIAGVAFYAPERMTDQTWNLLMLAVHPRRQRQGRGGALVRAVEEDLRRTGGRLLVIDTSGLPSFISQRDFYRRLGYRQQGRILDFYEPGDDKIVLAKPVDADATTSGVSLRPNAIRPNLRAAEISDLADLQTLARAFYDEDGFATSDDDLRSHLQVLAGSDSSHVVLAIDASGSSAMAIGFAITTTSFGLENGAIAELEDLYVTPPARGSGLGALLVEDAARWARARNCASLEVVLAPHGHDIDHLHAYYAALGFIDDQRALRSRPLR